MKTRKISRRCLRFLKRVKLRYFTFTLFYRAYSARAQLLFYFLNLLFGCVLVAVPSWFAKALLYQCRATCKVSCHCRKHNSYITAVKKYSYFVFPSSAPVKLLLSEDFFGDLPSQQLGTSPSVVRSSRMT